MAVLTVGAATLDSPRNFELVVGYAIAFIVEAEPGSVTAGFKVPSVSISSVAPTVEESFVTPTVQANQRTPSIIGAFATPTVQVEVEVLR
jgi:hypothetical protein